MSGRYFNWKLAIVLVMSLIVLGVSAFGLRKWRRANRAEEGLILGNKAYDEHKWEEAAEHLGKYIALERDNVPVLLKYADAQLKIRPAKRNRFQQAMNAYRAILRLDRDNTEAALQLSEIFLSMGSPGEAELVAKRQLETNPNPGLRRMLALALAGQRKFEEAAAELKSILQEHPGEILAYETLGKLVEQRPGDFKELPSHWYNQAVEKNPSSALAYIVRAGFYRRSEDFPGALADLERAEKQDLSDSTFRMRLAKELINFNALDKAQTHLVAVQQATPDDEDLWKTWASLAMKTGSKEKMLKVAREGLNELSSQPWDFMPLATEIFIRCDKLEEADDCISKMHEKDISSASVSFLRGLVASRQGNHSDAVKYWRQSMGQGNKSMHIRLALASALSRLGNTQSAIQQLRSLISESPGSFQGYLALGKLLAQTGNWAEAANNAAKAIQLSPGNQESALLYLRAQMQLLSTRRDDQGTMETQLLNDLRQQLSVLEKNAEPVGEIKLLQLQFALQQGKFAEAEALMAQLKDTQLPKERIVMAEAELLTAQGKIDQAIVRLNETVEEFGESIDLVRYLAILLDRKGNQKECEASIKKALERIEAPAVQRDLSLLLAQFYTRWEQKESVYILLSNLAEKQPNDIPIKRRLLLCEQVIANPEQAQQIVDDIKSIEGQDGWQWRYEQAKVWFGMDDFKNRYPQILSLLQENMQANPNDRTSHLLLARSYERAGEMQLAISTYREILSQSPDNILVVIPAVAALYNARQYDEAEQVLNRASRQNLYHPELQRLQLQNYLRQGQLDSASGMLQDLIDNDPNNQTACLSLALLKIQQGDYGQASELLDKLKILDPKSLPVTAAQIQLNIRQGKQEEALRICDEMVKSINNASVYILRARTYATLGLSGEAIKDLNHAVNIEPDNVEVWVGRSDFYRTTGQIKSASADIKRALSLDSDNVQLQKRAIPLFLASGQRDMIQEGKALLEKALESNSEDVQLQLLKARSALVEGTAPAIENAEQILQTITKDQPEISDAWVLLGEIAIKQGQPEEAMDAALGGLAYRPNNKSLLLLKARAEADKSPVLAIPTLKLLHEMEPGDLGIVVLMADTYLQTSEPQKAVILLREHLAACDVSAKRKCNTALAVALYKSGNKTEARKTFDSLLESDPDDPDPLLAHVKLLKDDKDWTKLNEKVVDWYTNHPEDNHTPTEVARDLMLFEDSQARKTAEDILRLILNNDSKCAEAISVLAILLQISGRDAESAILYQRLLELEPDNLIAINNLAWIVCEVQHKHQQALELAQRGLKIAPYYYDLIDTRGVIYYRLGEFDKAITDFNECIKLYPGITSASIGTRFYLARALAKLGQKDKAIQYLNEALKLNSQTGGLSTADLSDAQRLLNQLKEGS
ncbi:MAG: tetratricopeptide repeat protein [Planctomycetota bacterium]|jgi:tetratricopeptide (TPR) repeat protein